MWDKALIATAAAAASFLLLRNTARMGSSEPKAKGPEQMDPSKPEDLPGDVKNTKEKILGAATGVVQSFAPLKQIHQHVCAFHVYAHDFTRQVQAHHYCSHMNQDFRQCVIYDSDKPGARLVGIEYIISRKLFETLPPEERCYWHSHEYEVMSGMLIAPGVPEIAERQEMATLVDTYGKTIHTWQYDRGDELPLGPPQVMMAFRADGQLDPELLRQRDAEYGVDSAARREARKGLPRPEKIADGADCWKSGKAFQLQVQEVPVEMPGGT